MIVECSQSVVMNMLSTGYILIIFLSTYYLLS